jgi:hypothetical protein
MLDKKASPSLSPHTHRDDGAHDQHYHPLTHQPDERPPLGDAHEQRERDR